jgi:hypothetical protein
VLQVVGGALQSHEEDNREPVEHVVHCRARECALELRTVTHLNRTPADFLK